MFDYTVSVMTTARKFNNLFEITMLLFILTLQFWHTRLIILEIIEKNFSLSLLTAIMLCFTHQKQRK